MAEISRLSRLIAGKMRGIDLSANTLVVLDIKVGATTLTQTILDRLIQVQDGSDASILNLHTHDSRYRTQAELSSTTATTGASLIGSSEIRSTNDVQGILSIMDSNLATAESAIENHTDGNPSKHDASEIDVEGSYTNISAGDVEAALSDVDSALEARTKSADLASTDPGKGATLVGINDTGGLITATNVEDALQENRQQINLKANDADVIKKDGSVAFTADQSMNGNKLTDLAAPSDPNDAARKIDVDNSIAGIVSKEAVRFATTGPLPSSTYDNGASGVGATITADSNGAFPTTDTVVPALNDEILVKDEVAGLRKGIYVLTQLGDGSSPWILTRRTDFDGSPSSEVQGGMSTFVTEGDANLNTTFRLTGTGELTVGTDALDFVIYSRAEAITGTDGISVSPSLQVGLLDASNKGIKITSGVFEIDLDTDSGLSTAGDKLSVGAGTGITVSGGLTSVNMGAFNTDDLAEGSTNLYFTDARARTAAVDDTSYHTSWNGVTDQAPSKRAVYDKIESLSAGDIDFTPTVPGDWDVVHADVQDSLDEAASRIKELENQGGNESVIENMTAGEAMAANTLLCVRIAKAGDAGFVSGRVMLADKDATSADDFHVIGLVYLSSAASAGDTITVYKAGKMDLGAAHGLTDGEAHFLGDAGAVIDGGASGASAPSTVNHIAKKVCMARGTQAVEVQIEDGYVN